MTQIPFDSESTKPTVVQNELPQVKAARASTGSSGFFSRLSKTGLRSQLLMTVLPLALAPIAAASFVGYSVTQGRAEYELTKQLKGQSLLSGATISRRVEDELQVASIISKSPFLQGRVRNAIEVAESEELLQLSPEELEARFSRTKLAAPNQELNDFLTEAAKTEGLAEIIVTDRNGFNVGFTDAPIDFVQSDKDWWKQGKSQNQWVGAPVYDASVGLYGVDLTQQIVDSKTNSFLGVVKVFTPVALFEELSTLLADSGLRGSQQIQIVDANTQLVVINFRSEDGKVIRAEQQLLPKPVTDLGTRLAEALKSEEAQASDGNQQSQDDAPQQFEPIDPDRLNELQQQLRQSLPVRDLVLSTSQAATDAREPISLVASFYYQGRQYVLSTVPTLNWIAIASMDNAEVLVSGRELLYLFGIIGLALAAVGTVLTIALSRRLSAPLNDLSAKAQQVTAGNLDVAADPVGSAEARTLALTFNNLVFRVREFLQEQKLNTRRANLAAELTGAKLLSSQDLSPLLQKAVTEARDIVGSDRVVVYRFNPDWSGSIVAESVEETLPTALNEQLSDPCIPALSREKYLTDGILLEDDISQANLHPEHLAMLQDLNVKSILGVPVLSQGKLFGLLIAHHCYSTHTWQFSEIDSMKQLGLQLGLVIERVQLLEQTQALAEEQRQLKEALQRSALQLLIDVDPVSQGDLTVRAKVTEDEIGTVADSYNATIASLRKIVRQVQEAAGQVAETTGTNEAVVQTLTTSAAQQAEEILAALERVEEMANSVRQVAISAEKAEAAVQEAAQTVQEGDEAMNRTVDGILAIRETVAETAKKVKRLGESSQKISNVVNLISGFAAQTNMLALNASIEASRAGEDGKGFAVVAEEVRSLARQSAEATTEIEKLVASIQAETNEVVRAMEAGTEQVVTGTRLVDETRQSLNKITDASRQISQLVESIAEATITQSQASETVTTTMTTVAKIADENSVAASQVSASFEQLRSVAQALEAEVGRFKVS
jgi:methyl-accepting chemotaxis protein